MARIKLTTVGMPVGRRTKPREVDIDHARELVEYCRRGYTVSAHDVDRPMWRLTFTSYKPNGDWISRPYYNGEDGRLVDNHPPDWLMNLLRLVDSIKPPDVNFHPSFAIKEHTNE